MNTHLLRAGLLVLVTLTPAHGEREGWTTDFAAAKKQAAMEKKDILLNFTGSDWCPWCMKLDQEVFQKAAFMTGVKDKLVLVELDFPREEPLPSAATRAQNEKLRKDFKIKGYPFVFLCDASGKPYVLFGYAAGGPEKYVAQLNALMEVRAKRDAAFAAADRATESAQKAKNLVAGLKVMDDDLVDVHYMDVIARIGEIHIRTSPCPQHRVRLILSGYPATRI